MNSHVSFHPVIVESQRRTDGTYNVKIRLTYKRVPRILATQITAQPDDVTVKKPRKLKPGSNALLRANELVAEMYKAVDDLSYSALEVMTVDDVARYLDRKLHEGAVSFRLDFFEYLERFAAARRVPSTAGNYTVAANALKRYLGRDTLDISEITGTMLLGFQEHLRQRVWRTHTGKEAKSGRKILADASPNYYVAALKTVYNAAKLEYNDEEEGIINIPKNPFAKLPKPKPRPPMRTARPVAFIQKLISFDGPLKPNERRALDIYILSFALMGMNVADLYEAKAPDGDVLSYKRRKTRNNRLDEALIRVKLDPRIKPILARWKDPTGKYFIRAFRVYSSADSMGDIVNKALAKWAKANGEERFTMYSARHSWATIARSSACGVDKATVDECLDHVGDHKLADVYIEKDWSILWAANKKVLDLFTWPTE